MRKWLFFCWVGFFFLSACNIVSRPTQEPLPTITPLVIVVTSTSTPAATPTALPPTNTPLPSATAIPTRLPSPTLVPTQVRTPEAVKPFRPQAGTRRTIPAFTHIDLGCSWSGIAGQVLDTNGKGLANILVILTGQVDGKSVDQIGETAEQSPYGPGGYELKLSGRLPAVGQGLILQLFDEKGQVLSDPLTFQIPGACEQNLLLINFQAQSALVNAFLPVVSRTQ